MSREDKIKNLLSINNRNLQKLKEQKAKFGIHVPVYILTEIEDIEAEIEKLQIELNAVVSTEYAVGKRIKGKLLWLWIGVGVFILVVIVGAIINLFKSDEGTPVADMNTTKQAKVGMVQLTEELVTTTIPLTNTSATEEPTTTPIPLTNTPTNTPTYTPNPLPTATQVVTPTATITPIPTPTPTYVSNAPSTINLQDVRKLLLSQSSFRWILTSAQFPPDMSQFEVTEVREPESIRVSVNTEPPSNWVKINTREWFGLGTEPTWYPMDKLPPNMSNDASKLRGSIQEIMIGSLGVILPNNEAKLVQSSVVIDGTLSNEYTWSNEEEIGHVFIAEDSGLPVRGELGSIRINFSHINAPSNALQFPVLDFPDKLHFDDARMSLNGLSSFQWSSSTVLDRPSNRVEMSLKGTYVLADQAWQAFYWSNAEMSGTPLLEFMIMDHEPWLRTGDRQEAWYQASTKEMQDQAEMASPFDFWRWTANAPLGYGTLVGQESQSIDGIKCNEYILKAQWQTEAGISSTAEMHLFVAPINRIPMRAEFVISGDSATMHRTQELSRVNDPTNVVTPLY